MRKSILLIMLFAGIFGLYQCEKGNTNLKEIPTGEINNISIEKDNITFDVDMVDEDSTITRLSVILVDGDGNNLSEITQHDGLDKNKINKNLCFDNLGQQKMYKLKIVANYNDGKSEHELAVLDEYEFTTKTSPEPAGTIENIVLVNNNITFDVNMSDEDALITTLSVVLVDDSDNQLSVITQENGLLSNGLNEDMYFYDLEQETTYKIQIVGNYNIGGSSYDSVILDEYEFTTGTWITTTEPIGKIENIILNNDTILFDANIEDISNLITNYKIVLVYNSEIIKELTPDDGIIKGLNNDIYFNGLMMNCEYKIQLIADFNADTNIVLDEVSVTVADRQDLPSVIFANVEETCDSVAMFIDITDNNNVINGMSIILKDENNSVINIINQLDGTDTNIVFLDLNPNTNYKVVVIVDYNDYASIVLDEYSFTTLVKNPPLGNIANVVKTNDSISFDIGITDVDSAISSIKAVIYKGETTIEEKVLNDNETNVVFSNLLSSTEYKIILKVDYDLVDGNGVYSDVILDSKTMFTYTDNMTEPIRIKGVKFDDNTVDINEEVLLIIELVNESELPINSVVINDIEYSQFESMSTNERIILKFDSGLLVGNKEFKVNSINYTDNEENIIMNFINNNTVELAVLGKVEIKDIEYDLLVDYGTSPVITINLFNPNDYDINSITINYNEYTVFEEGSNYNKIIIKLNSSLQKGLNRYFISNIKYSYDDEFKSDDISNTSIDYFNYELDDVVEIYTAEDLLNINNNLNGVYRLMNDIDLSGVEFTPIGEDVYNEFKGFFDGNGYTISNLKIDKIVNEESDCFYGLFGYAKDAYIINVNVDNIDINVENLGNGKVNVGGLVGSIEFSSKIINTHVTGVIRTNSGVNRSNTGGLVGGSSFGSITIKNSSSAVNVIASEGNAGGLIGYGSYSNIENSYATGDVNSSHCHYTGGLAGYLSSSTIKNSYAIGNVTSSFGYGTGGLIGYSSLVTLENSYATGDVISSNSYNTGGLIGKDSQSTINNSYAIGSVTSNGYTTGGLIGTTYSSTINNSFAIGNVSSKGIYTGRIVGENRNSTFNNIYRYEGQVITNENGDPIDPSDSNLAGVNVASIDDISNYDWYINTLRFNDSIWDLDVLNDNYYPILKNITLDSHKVLIK